MIPQYSTQLFCDIYEDAETFKEEFLESPFAGCIHSGETVGNVTYPDNVTLLFYLLYSKYGNNPIANEDITQFKYKLFATIFQYGPSWEKRLDIQKKLRELSEDDIIKGSRAIYNTALNPSTAPSTATLEELEYINSQNTTNYKKSKMDAYAQLWELIDTDVTEEFLDKFKRCFKIFVSAERPLIYVTEDEEEEED